MLAAAVVVAVVVVVDDVDGFSFYCTLKPFSQGASQQALDEAKKKQEEPADDPHL